MVLCVFISNAIDPFQIEIDEKDTIENIIKLVREKLSVNSNIRLIYSNEFLSPTDTLESINYASGAPIFVDIQCSVSVPQPTIAPIQIEKKNSNIKPPENYQELLDELVSLGYEEENCKKALSSALYNLERAADFLVNGYIPENPTTAYKTDNKCKIKIEACEKENEINTEDKQKIQELAKNYHKQEIEVLQLFIACGKNFELTETMCKGSKEEQTTGQ